MNIKTGSMVPEVRLAQDAVFLDQSQRQKFPDVALCS